jgi:hypothetical protein
LIEALEELVDSGTRGDPVSPLKWTIKSTRSITRELRRQNFSVGSTKVGELLKSLGYSCHWALQNQPLMGASKPAEV